jgi:hypothetical protein
VTIFPVQDGFTRGEISPRLHSRASLDLYRAGLSACRNLITLPHGGIRKRGGTYFVNEAKYPDAITRLIDFRFSESQAYCLEFGHLYCRIYANGGYITEIATPWPQGDLFGLQYTQSADVMWIVHPSHAPRRLTRRSATSWTVDVVEFTDGPFEAANLDEALTVYASAISGPITLTANTNIFSPSDVGRLFRIEMESYRAIQPWEPYGRIGDSRVCRYDGNVYQIGNGPSDRRFGGTPPTHTRGTEQDGPMTDDPSYDDVVGVTLTYLHSGFGVARITGFVNVAQVNAVVLTNFPAQVVGAGNAEYLYSFGAFSPGGYPVATTIYEERLMFASKLSVFGSKIGDFSSFRIGEKDDDALEFLLAANEANDILWLADADGYLAIGTTGGVRGLAGSGVDEALTPTSFKNRSSSTMRCSGIRPLSTGMAFLYVAGGQTAIAEMMLNSGGRFEGVEASQISEHIPKQGGGVKDAAYQANHDQIAWFVLASGEMMGFTYQRDQEVRGFHRHLTGVQSVCVTPNGTGPDDVWMVVRRVVNGQVKQFIEILQQPFEYADKANAFAVDCGLTYRGSPTFAVTGMSHLNGERVDMLADGVKHRNLLVQNGAVGIPNNQSASVVHVGLPTQAYAETLELDVGGRDGSIIGRRKRITKVILSLLETDLSGLRVESLKRGGWEVAKNPSHAVQDNTMQLYTGNMEVMIDDSWEGQGRIRITHEGPGPCTIRSIVPAFDSEGQ